jgi:hypothetical protein
MNRTTKTLLIAGLAAIVGSAAVAGAVRARDFNDGHRGPQHGWNQRGDMMRGDMMMHGQAFMDQYDTNKDGNLTQAEIDQARKDKLAKFDANKDGKLDLKEYEALWLDAHRQQMVRDFQRLDADGDAIVTQDEYTKPFAKMVDAHDRNHDGKLNKDDMRGPGRGRDAAPAAPATPAEPKGAKK